MEQDKVKLKQYISKINDYFGGNQIVSYYSDTRNKGGVPSITGRIEGGVDGITIVMKNVFNKNVVVSKLSGEEAKRVSGKHDSFSVRISELDGFYFRSVIGERGSLAAKDLTPSKLGFNGKRLNKKNFYDETEKALMKQEKIPMEVLSLAKELLIISKTVGSEITPNKKIKELLASIPSSDLKVLGKNFGEIIIANWCLYNKQKAISIYFPKEENNPLADFVVEYLESSGIPPLNVSAKFEGGANASINSILKKDSKPPKEASKEESIAFEAIMAVSFDKVIDGLLRAESLLNTPEYTSIKKMCQEIGHNTVTKKSISDVVERALNLSGISTDSKRIQKPTQKQFDLYKKNMSEFYSSINNAGMPKLDSMEQIAKLGSGNFYHPVFYAFSVALAERFNKNAIFKNVLNKAAKSIKAEQIYLDITNSSIKMNVKQFSESEFKFAQGAYSYLADNVRMKVNMIK